MKLPHQMTALMDRGGRPTVRELLSSLVFNPVGGAIRLNGNRLVMQRAAFGAELRRQLVRTLGEEEARSYLIRRGFQLGKIDAKFVRQSWQNLDIGDGFTAGTRLHTVSGVVRVETVHNDFDFAKRFFSGEFGWHDSVKPPNSARTPRLRRIRCAGRNWAMPLAMPLAMPRNSLARASCTRKCPAPPRGTGTAG